MRALLLTLLLLATQPISAQEVQNADEITYEWLVHYAQKTGSIDHIPHFRKIFNQLPVKTLMEFGMGYGTKYFLDNCNKVISVEFISPGYGPAWMKNMLELYKESSNWIPIAYFTAYTEDIQWAPYKYMGSESIHKACSYQCSTKKNYALIDGFYLSELNSFMNALIKAHQIKIVCINPVMYLRGDIVQLLFNKVPIIVAHDTLCRAQGEQGDVYGYSRIMVPENYDEIYFPGGQGTTIWISKNESYTELVKDLQVYAQGLKK